MEYSLTLLHLVLIVVGPASCSFQCDPLQNIIDYANGKPCGDGQCMCSDSSASCYGSTERRLYSSLPVLGRNVTKVHAMCYNFSYLSTDSFINIKYLHIEMLSLTYCGLMNIALDTFSIFGNLSILEIHHSENINRTHLFDSLQTLNETLTNLTLSDISLQYFDVHYFSKFRGLIHLDLSGNILRGLAGKMSIGNLTYLNLINNDFQGGSLHFCIDTTLNNGTKIGSGSPRENTRGLFPELRVLDLGRNVLGDHGKRIKEHFYCLKKLEYLDLSNNTIGIVNMSQFKNLTNLTMLLLSYNWIKQVEGGILPRNLEHIDFRNNQLTPFPPKLCENNNNRTLLSMKRVDLGRNYIINLTTNWYLCMPNLEWLDFSRNDVRCIKNNTFKQYKNLKYLYLANLIPMTTEIEPEAFSSQSLETLSLRFNRMNFSSNINLQKSFQFCPNLRRLDVSYNYIENVTLLQKILQPMKKLEYLHLEKIYLYPFPYYLLTSLPRLKELNVNRNIIYTIFFDDNFNNALLNLSIERISAARSFIHTIDERTFPLSIRKSLKYFNLADNQFRCDCEMRWFRDAVDKSGRIKESNIQLIDWQDKYVCRSPATLGGQKFWTYKPIERCTFLSPVFVALIAVGSTLFVFSFMTAVLIRNRWYIKYWIFKIGRRRRAYKQVNPERDRLLSEERYDGYVVYNTADNMFVHHAFRELIENELGYKLHIWERDADSGATVDVVLNAMYASKHVIVAVSNNILKDQWARFQVDVALDKSIRESSDVLFVKLDTLDPRRLSRTWCVLMTRTPTVVWSDDKDSIECKLFKEVIRKRFGKKYKIACR